jgi:hypothetical protein
MVYAGISSEYLISGISFFEVLKTFNSGVMAVNSVGHKNIS